MLFQWGEVHQVAFKKVHDILNSPRTISSPVQGLSLTLYLNFNNKSFGALLAQEVEAVEHPVYYLNRSLRGVEMNYSSIECHYLTLIFATPLYYLVGHSLDFDHRVKFSEVSFVLTNQTGRTAR